jgi:hypothetical protein
VEIVSLGFENLQEALIGDETPSKTRAFSLCQSAAGFASVNSFISLPLVALLGSFGGAATVNLFGGQALPKNALAGTLQTDGAEDEALPGGNLRADSGEMVDAGSGGAGGGVRHPPGRPLLVKQRGID